MRGSLLGVVTVLSAACAFNAPTTPTASTSTTTTTVSAAPASIRLAASSRTDYQTSVVATVLTADGHFVAGIPIGFSTAAGTLAPSLATTDAKGSATTIVSTPSITMVTVTIGAITNSISVSGASEPNTGTPVPPTTPPAPPSVRPTATINVASTSTTGTVVTLGVSAPALGQTWTWSFGDGTTAQTTAFTISHTYATAGTFTATVSAPGVNSGSAVIAVTNPVGSVAPTLVASLTCTAGTHGVTTGNATVCNVSATYGGAVVPSASITSVSWDWGDGTAIGTGVSSSRLYTQAGTYTIFVTVTATTTDGSKQTTTSKSVSPT